jgi:hypothetical protein
MPEVVRVSTVENDQGLMASIEDYFKRGRYAELTQAIGIHSLLIDPQHTMLDQTHYYRKVLDLLKDRVRTALGKHYSAWYASFPKLMHEIVSAGGEGNDKLAMSIIASHREAYGPFKSVDDFFFWALEERRLELDQIVNYIEKTIAMPCL